jgi:hypothetical protein
MVPRQASQSKRKTNGVAKHPHGGVVKLVKTLGEPFGRQASQ